MPSPTQETGAEWERRAEERLLAAGYRVVARNWRGGGGEVDRIAWDREVLCFVEVRWRAHGRHGTAAESIDWRKQAKVARAAAAYLARYGGRPPEVRFDVVTATGEVGVTGLEIIQNAFDAGA